MSHTRQDAHKYARLKTDNSHHKHNSDIENDEEEEIDLGSSSQRFHYSDELEEDLDLNDNSANRSRGANGSLYHHSSANQNIVTLKTQLSNSRFMQNIICTLLTILAYLALSILLTFYQKALIKELKFPMSIVSYHLVLKLMLATLVRFIYKSITGKERTQLDFRTSVRKMAPTGIASGIDLGFSNWGLELVSISLYTMTKSSTLVFILIFAIILGLEKKSWSLVFIVSLIAVGLFMFVYKSTQFKALGFIFILVASLSGGIRWTLAQFVMQKSKLGLHNPIDMIYHMQPWMIVALLPFVMVFELKDFIGVLENLHNIPNSIIFSTIMKITFAALLAFVMEVFEFLVLSRTSSLTLSISGIFKDIFQVALAVELNHDELTLINVLGLVVCLAGISCHVVHKYATLTKSQNLHSYNDNIDDDDDDVAFDLEASHNSAADHSSHHSSSLAARQNKQSSITAPLLDDDDDDIDSDDDKNSPNKQNSSDVIFDILKRRDMQR